jgi:hypothetical protein
MCEMLSRQGDEDNGGVGESVEPDADTVVDDIRVPGAVKMERYGRCRGRTAWLAPHTPPRR